MDVRDIAAIVERASRYVLLVHLPLDRTAERMRDALAVTIQTLPVELRRPLTWDQGSEMGLHHQLSRGFPGARIGPSGGTAGPA